MNKSNCKEFSMNDEVYCMNLRLMGTNSKQGDKGQMK